MIQMTFKSIVLLSGDGLNHSEAVDWQKILHRNPPSEKRSKHK